MSATYRMVNWNRHKRVYDAVAGCSIGLFIAVFFVASQFGLPSGEAPDPVVTLIRATGVAAIVMLHVILVIGPVCRLSPMYLPLLYNRRHLGVMTAGVAVVHALLVLFWYHGFGVISPFASLLASNTRYDSIAWFPFETLGVVALVILLMMAATSHDYWLALLSPRVWKGLHMLVYWAYGLLLAHVALGALMSEKSVVYPFALGAGLVVVAGLHLMAAMRRDVYPTARDSETGWVEVARLSELAVGVAVTRDLPGGERIAVVRREGEHEVAALSGTCAHQGGPLGEGRLIDGCLTCPWHGYQYRPGDGCSPPPYTERLTTYAVRIEGEAVLVDPTSGEVGRNRRAEVVKGGVGDG